MKRPASATTLAESASKAAKQADGSATGKCLVCRSGHREEIDRRLLNGDDSRSVVRWLEEQGDPIYERSLRRHRENHLRPTELARTILAERQQPVREAAERMVADADMLDEVATMAVSVARAQLAMMTGAERKPLADVTLFNGCLREARECAVARHEILNGKKVNLDAHVSGGLAGLFAELERRESVGD